MSNHQTEIEFGTQFIESGNLTKLTKDPYHIREFESLNGIPDLILVSGSVLGTFKKFEEKYGYIGSTSGAARILVVLNKKSFTDISTLLSVTGLSRSYLTKVLKDLIELNVIEHSIRRGYRIDRDFELPNPRIISIEFKLDNWQKALVQATRHSAFAARSFVIMPSSKQAIIEKNIQHFANLAISVGVFDSKTNDFTILWKAPLSLGARRSKSKVSYIDSLYRMLNSLDRLETVSV